MGKGSTGTASGPVKKRVRRGLFSASFSGPCMQNVSGSPWKGGWHADIKGTEKHGGNCATKTKNADSPATPVIREADCGKEGGGESAGIAAYWNGYAVYHVGRDATVFRIHACSGYCYDSGSSPSGIGSGTFDGEAWYLRLVLEGKDRLFRNLASREQGWNVSYSAVSEEWGALDSGTEGALDRIISTETVKCLLSVLSERQRRAAVLFYIKQKKGWQIAEELGITASAVSKILARALERMRACMQKNTAPAGSGKA